MGWGWYPKPKPRRPANGIKAQSKKFGQTWWGEQWLEALERLVDSGRLSRGRSYARSGQVLNLDIESGEVKARVQGSRPTPYKVSIELARLSEREWDKVLEALAGQALFAAKLLAGEMPANIEEAFAKVDISLFPQKQADLVTECSCPDYSNPCKHISAVYYLLAERFDTDPFLLFRLRGRTKEQLMAALRQRRSAREPTPTQRPKRVALAEKFAPLAERLDAFWGVPPVPLRLTLIQPEAHAASVKQLGEPSFWAGGPFITRLEPTYANIAEAAEALMLGDT